MNKNVRYALVIGAIGIVMVAAEVLIGVQMGLAGLFAVGMASGIWMGGDLR